MISYFEFNYKIKMSNNYYTNPFTSGGFNFNSSSSNNIPYSSTSGGFNSSNNNIPYSSTSGGFDSSTNTQQPSVNENKENPTNVIINKPQTGNSEQFVFLLAESKINLKHDSVIKKINCERPHVIQKGTKKEIYLKVPGFTNENIDINLVDQKIIIQGKRMIPVGDEDYEKIYEVFLEEVNVYPETKIEDIMVKTYFGILIIYIEIPSNRLPKKILFSN